MKKTFIFLLYPLLIIAQPQEIHCKHFFFGYPLGTPATNDLIIRDLYALSSNDETKFADWVAYRLTIIEVDGKNELGRNWEKDPWLDEDETLEPKPADDYKDTYDILKMDRGHLAPIGSFKGSKYAYETNYYSNIMPQKSILNRGLWVKLEGKERDIVKTLKTIYVMVGSLYELDMPDLPKADENHKIPSGFWKIIVVLEDNEAFNTAAFIFNQNTQVNADIMAHLTTIDDIESKSGLDFFWELNDTEESLLENSKHEQWAEEIFD